MSQHTSCFNTSIPHITSLNVCRAAYSMARLQLRDPSLLVALAQHTTGRLAGAAPEALAGLAVGLALGGHTPSQVRHGQAQGHAQHAPCL